MSTVENSQSFRMNPPTISSLEVSGDEQEHGEDLLHHLSAQLGFPELLNEESFHSSRSIPATYKTEKKMLLISLSNKEESSLKKKLRLMRNRESANLSRQKKKEYVIQLEEKIKNVKEENLMLKEENEEMRVLIAEHNERKLDS